VRRASAAARRRARRGAQQGAQRRRELRRVQAELSEYVERMSQAEHIARFGVWKWDIASGRVTDESGETLAPAAFLPAAERFHLIGAIDVWMVRQALALADGFCPEVNLSAVTIVDADARGEIVGLLEAAPQAASRIVFEITETAALEHLDAARAFAESVTRLGCGLALDDFGTGFGSFTYLRELPLRYLKIDTSFVRDLVGSPDDLRVVQSIIGIAAQFGLRTIAEGVEDAATLELLRGVGADFAQGFHLGRPAPVRAVTPA